MNKLRVTQFDAVLLLIVALCTLVPLAGLSVYAGYTDYNLSPGLVTMIVGWFFGATMVWLGNKLFGR